jgi:hypothetical protein
MEGSRNKTRVLRNMTRVMCVCVCVCVCVFVCVSVRPSDFSRRTYDAKASLVKALCMPNIFPDLHVKYLVSLAAAVLHLLHRSIGLG